MADDIFKVGSQQDLVDSAAKAAAEEAAKQAQKEQEEEYAAAAKRVAQAPEHQSEKLVQDSEIEDGLSFLKTK